MSLRVSAQFDHEVSHHPRARASLLTVLVRMKNRRQLGPLLPAQHVVFEKPAHPTALSLKAPVHVQWYFQWTGSERSAQRRRLDAAVQIVQQEDGSGASAHGPSSVHRWEIGVASGEPQAASIYRAFHGKSASSSLWTVPEREHTSRTQLINYCLGLPTKCLCWCLGEGWGPCSYRA